MIITKTFLSRRTVLRGIGATVALPLLEAMVPPMTALARTNAKPPHRLGFIYTPMGADMAGWTPVGRKVGLGTLSRSLEPLSNLNGQVTVLTNVGLEHATVGGHATANAGFLSGTRSHWTESGPCCLGKTVDQVAAKAFEPYTRLPSLELALDVPNLAKQVEYGSASKYLNHLSWLTPSIPAVSEARPEAVFTKLFGGDGRQFYSVGSTVAGRSVLDALQEPRRRLGRVLGAADRRTTSLYLDQVREVERRIQIELSKATEIQSAQDFDRPVGAPLRYSDHVELLFDLQLLALRTDITRVVSFQLAREMSSRVYVDAGVTEPHHDVSHYAGDSSKRAAFRRINRYHLQLVATYLQRLASVSDGDGTLLDTTTYLYGSGMGDPNYHDHSNLPIVIIGGRRNESRGIQHYRFEDRVSLSTVHASLLAGLGIEMGESLEGKGLIAPIVDLHQQRQNA